MSAVPESKTQRLERLKREKNAWDHLDEIREFARLGFDSIPPDWFATYFRSWGVYTQGDGAGVTGGQGGEGKSVPFFMLRIRIPNGLLTSHQVRVIADLSEQHGNGVADLTVRQNIQLHWIRLESLPAIFESLHAIGLRTIGACGDVARNITGCPLAGLHHHELADVSPLALALDRELGGNPEFYNLPRKFKITVTGCPDWCSYPEINDIALTATPRIANGRHEIGYSLRVGGGLSTEPHLAVRLNAFVREHQAIPVVRAITELFRDSIVLRQSRNKARLKFLFLEHGWTADSFLAALHDRLGFQLDPAAPETLPAQPHRDHLGVIPQQQPGLSSVGASVLRGRITPAQLRVAADLAERFADGHLRATPMQNLLLVNVPSQHLSTVVSSLTLNGLPVQSSAFARGTIACTGSEFCKLALTETKSFARFVTEQLEARFPDFSDEFKLHITGCPNSCGQHWIAGIGIEGKKLKIDGKLVDAYYFCLGGDVGPFASIARPIGYRCPASEVPDAIARLLEYARIHRNEGEPLSRFFVRHSADELRAVLAGHAAPPVLRDLPAGPVPSRSRRMTLFPIFLKLHYRLAVIIGGGQLASSKISALLEAGARIRIVSPQLNSPLRELVSSQRIEWREKLFSPDDLDGAFLVIAATSLPDVNHAVFAEADRRGILCNAVDDIANCHFYYGSIVQRGDLQIAISTNGKSPALAQRIRKQLELAFPEDYAPWLEFLGAAREALRSQPHDPETLKHQLHVLASQPMFEQFLAITRGDSPAHSSDQGVA